MRRAVIVVKGKHIRMPRAGPVVSGKTLLDRGSEIRSIGSERLSVHQERQHAIRNAAIILEIGLLGLDDLGHQDCEYLESHLKFQDL